MRNSLARVQHGHANIHLHLRAHTPKTMQVRDLKATVGELEEVEEENKELKAQVKGLEEQTAVLGNEFVELEEQVILLGDEAAREKTRADQAEAAAKQLRGELAEKDVQLAEKDQAPSAAARDLAQIKVCVRAWVRVCVRVCVCFAFGICARLNEVLACASVARRMHANPFSGFNIAFVRVWVSVSIPAGADALGVCVR